MLWYFTMKYAWRDGDLRRFTARTICQAVGWDKDEATFINALQQTGWIEKDSLQVHDWLDYAGKLVTDRLYNEKRRKTSLNVVNPRKTGATLPYPTLPKTTTSSVADESFEAFWKAYPKKIGKGAAEKAWKKIPSREAAFETIRGAVAAQVRSEQWLKDGGQFIPHPATWLNQRRWEDEIKVRDKVVG